MKKVTLVEVGARDGLQNEKDILSPEVISELISKLIRAGANRIEAGAFVSPQWVPQMKGTPQVLSLLKKDKGFINAETSVLVPNEKGFELALENGVKEISLFAACSESFSRKNVNCTIEESFERFAIVSKLAKKHKIRTRGYLSVCFGCPFEGLVPEKKVVELTQRFLDMGAYEVSIGDTIGVAHAGQVKSLFKKLLNKIPAKKLAGHFHDTRGQALVNIFAAFEMGIGVFDTSLGGLGGCPYAPGAKGNVATEDVVYMFEGMGISTGFELKRLLEINRWTSNQLGRALPSRMGAAGILQPTNKLI